MRILEKPCEQCGQTFTGTYAHGRGAWKKRRFCSQQCKADSQRGQKRSVIRAKNCQHCGALYQGGYQHGRDRWERRKFCSRKCKVAASKGVPSPRKGVETAPVAVRFWAKVQKGEPCACWEWLGVRGKTGYGGFQHGGRRWIAHRMAWILTFGEIPEAEGFHGLCVCHKCDNRGCVNPWHLFLGPHFVNMRDRNAKGRTARNAGERHGMARLTEMQAKAIRQLWDSGQYTQGEIGDMFGVSNTTVCLVVNRKTWKET